MKKIAIASSKHTHVVLNNPLNKKVIMSQF